MTSARSKGWTLKNGSNRGFKLQHWRIYRFKTVLRCTSTAWLSGWDYSLEFLKAVGCRADTKQIAYGLTIRALLWASFRNEAGLLSIRQTVVKKEKGSKLHFNLPWLSSWCSRRTEETAPAITCLNLEDEVSCYHGRGLTLEVTPSFVGVQAWSDAPNRDPLLTWMRPGQSESNVVRLFEEKGRRTLKEPLKQRSKWSKFLSYSIFLNPSTTSILITAEKRSFDGQKGCAS